MAKTNWQYGEIVTEEDFNQLGQEVNEATAGLAVLDERLEETEQSSKAYTDQQIQLVTATGIPKLVTYSYVLAADQQGQTDFEIPLETFVKETDTVTVAQNSTVLSTERYSVVDPKIVRLAEGVNIGTEIFVQVWKNVPIGSEGAISAAVLANDTVTESKMADEMKKDVPGGVVGYDAFATHLADFTQQIPYALTAGNENTYTVSTTPALPALVSGVAITVKIHAANTGAATLNWNGKGAKAIKKANGGDVSSGNLKLNGVYTLRYDGTSFILQGEGGEYAKLSNLIRNGNFVNGTNGWSGVTVTSGVAALTATAQWGGAGTTLPLSVANGDKIYYCASVKPPYANVRIGVSTGVGGGSVVLTATVPNNTTQFNFTSLIYTSTATNNLYFAVYDVSTGPWSAISFNNALAINLTKVYGAGKEPTKEEIDEIVQYYGGWWDSDLQLLTSDANAVAGDMLSGKTGYVNGAKVTGTMPDRRASWIPSPGISPMAGRLHMAVPIGYYDNATDNGVYYDDLNYVASNILAGKNIFGLSGTAIDGTGMKRSATGTITATGNNQTIGGLAFRPYWILMRDVSNVSKVYWISYAQGVNADYINTGNIISVTDGSFTFNSYNAKTMNWIAIEQ